MRTTAVAFAAACLSLGSVQAATAVKVSVGGTPVEAHARATGEVVVGDVLPVLTALGARAEYAQRLTGTAYDGRSFEAAPGANELTVGGVAQPLAVPLTVEEGRLTGPLRDLAQALGCRAWYRAGGGEVRIAGRLAQVEAHAADEGALVHLQTTGPSEAKLEHLTDPPRAYADLPGIAWNGASEAIQAGGTGGLIRIRWALNQEWPPVTRVVLDLAPGAEARLTPAQDGLLVVTVRPAAGSAPAPAGGASAASAKTLEGLHIVLDPAGGGDDVGARGSGTTEKAVALDVALQAAAALMDLKALVTLTRDSDRPVAPQVRADFIRCVSPDVVVRLGCAAGKPEEQGVATQTAAAHAALGEAVRKAVVEATGASDRGAAPPIAAADAPREPTATCIVGFLTSPTEGKLLASAEYRKKLAAGLAAGVAAGMGR